jgi:protein TonB
MRKSLIALAVLLVSFTTSVTAAEVPASMDQKSCTFKYPKAALLNEEEGSTSVQAVISAHGKVESIKVTSSSGSKALDKATVDAITECKFKPGTVDGKVSTTTTSIVYVWKLSK